MEDSTTSINGVTEFEGVLGTKDTTVVTSIPAEPGDFLRVRLIRFSVEYRQSDEANPENEYHAEAEASEQAVIEPQGEDPYDSDCATTSTFYIHRHSHRYVNREPVGARPERSVSHNDTRGYRRRVNGYGEHVTVVPYSPTPRTAPFNLTRIQPFHAQEPSRPLEYYSGPYIEDERVRVYGLRRPPSSGDMTDHEERDQHRRERETARQVAEKIKERIVKTNAIIAQRKTWSRSGR